MKIGTFVLALFSVVFFISATGDNTGLTVGYKQGGLAPGIESLKGAENIRFQNHSGRYTILSFWAASDAESRAANVQLQNEINRMNSDKLSLYSISLDKSESVFKETVRIDRLDVTCQLHDKEGIHSTVYKKYGLKKGFRNFLIDDRGVIVGVNVKPDELSAKLKS